MRRKGFTLIELLVVVLIIGILASVAMPQYFKTVEKGRSSEAIAAIAALSQAQSRAEMRSGSWTTDMNELDVSVANLKFFTVTLAANQITLTRNLGAATSPIGAYTIVYNRGGYYNTNNNNAKAFLP